MREALISPIFVSHWLAYCLTGGDKMEKIADENLSVSISCPGLWAAETEAHCFVSNVYQRAWLNCCVQGNSPIDGKQHHVLIPLQAGAMVSRIKPKMQRCQKSPLTSRLFSSIIYHMPFVVTQEAKQERLRSVVLTSPCLSSHPFFFPLHCWR